VGLIHQRTGLAIEDLMEGSAAWKSPGNTIRFKKATGVTEEKVRPCHGIARQAAAVVAQAVTTPLLRTYPSAEELHADLKAAGTESWVTLGDLVEWCWKSGIPVIHVSQFPDACRKPDGMALKTNDDRPVIVLCRQTTSPAWQSFILAHELAHIILGHVPSGGAVVDSQVANSSEEKEEIDANAFASIVLTGQSDMGLYSRMKMYPGSLAEAALDYGRRNRVSPAVVALNWGFNIKDWAVANGAVQLLEKDENALRVLRECGSAALEWDHLSADAAEWLERMAGLTPLRDSSPRC
jgi:hypothetical protein